MLLYTVEPFKMNLFHSTRMDREAKTFYNSTGRMKILYNDTLLKKYILERCCYTGVTTTIIKSKWDSILHKLLPLDSRTILAFDCDSEKHLSYSTTYVKKVLGLEYCLIQSSEGHSWVIVDYISTFKEVASIMLSLPGTDNLHCRYSVKRKNIIFRGLPRYGFYPKFPKDTSNITNQEVRDWITEFKAHFDSDIVSRYYRGMVLKLADADTSLVSNLDKLMALGGT
jgi:hypothetical protein